jgi:hypothetical protein
VAGKAETDQSFRRCDEAPLGLTTASRRPTGSTSLAATPHHDCFRGRHRGTSSRAMSQATDSIAGASMKLSPSRP